VTPVAINPDFKTLPPNARQIVDIKAGIPGISGQQLITTDAKGFRATKNVDYSSDKSYRIFAIGGSTTEQIYLDDKKTWTHLLQEYLSRTSSLDVEVINTGVSGLRAKHHLATLESVAHLHPNMAIFLLGINDWDYHIENSFSTRGEKSKLAEYREKLIFRETMMGNAILQAFNALKRASEKPRPLIKEEYGEYYSRQRGSLNREITHIFYPDAVQQSYKDYLVEISATCHANNIRCLFVTQPTGYKNTASEEYKKGFWMTPPDQSYTLDFESMVAIANLYNTYLIQFSKSNNHNICDAASELAPSYNNFYDDCHLNIEGARRLSKIIGKCIGNVAAQHHT
jgi:lysophospholipase L1-like esterase